MQSKEPNLAEQIKQRKSEYWQIVRGVCILAVIMIHCPIANKYTAVNPTVWLVLRAVINFPVALFVFMAGYFVNTEKVKQNTILYYLTRGGVDFSALTSFGRQYI